MKQNQKFAIIGIILATIALAALVYFTTGTSDSKSNKEDAHQHSEDEGKDSKSKSEKEHKAGDGDNHAKSSDGKDDGHGHSDSDGDDHSAEEAEADAVSITEEAMKLSGVETEKTGEAILESKLTLPGEIRFNQDRTAHIVPRVDGVVENVYAELGQQVKKGQLLATIASTSVSEMRSEARGAQKRLALAKITYEREKKLWEEKISAQQDYLQAEQVYQEAMIAAQNASQKLIAIGADTNSSNAMNRFELRAPFDGMLVERHLSMGEAVTASTNVMTLSDLSNVWAEIAVPAKELNSVLVGMSVKVRATSFESEVMGKVSYVGSLLGEQTRTATARVTLQNPKLSWRPGLFVNVDIVSSETKVPVTVTSDAIQSVEERTVVFVRTPDGFKATPVETGRTDGKHTEIKKGLEAGTVYASKGAFILKSELGKSTAEHAH